jgi:hypothetical protein
METMKAGTFCCACGPPDPSEGFRMMAQGDNDLSIGDEVTGRSARFAGRLFPISQG